MKWSEVIAKYQDWEFKSLDTIASKMNIQNLHNVWKRYGPDFCVFYSGLFGTKMNFTSSFGLGAGSTHFILCLDESGSMNGSKWENVKRAVVSLISTKELSDESNKISIVSFNEEAHLRCERKLIDSSVSWVLRTYSGGGTDFGPPLSMSLQLIKNSLDEFDQHLILLYTDGLAGYPQKQMDSFSLQTREVRSKIKFTAVCEHNQPAVLHLMANNFNQIVSAGECRAAVSTEVFISQLPEILVSSMHNL